MPKFIVYADTFGYYYAIAENFIIEFQIKILVEMIHHLTKLDFYSAFFSLHIFSFYLPIFYYISHCYKLMLLVHFSAVPLICCLLLIQIP